MSGGAYGYAYQRVIDFASGLAEDGQCDAVPPALRRAFAEHCLAVAMAMKACEYNDSGDGDSRERELIEEVLSKGAIASIEATAKERLLKAAREVIAALDGDP